MITDHLFPYPDPEDRPDFMLPRAEDPRSSTLRFVLANTRNCSPWIPPALQLGMNPSGADDQRCDTTAQRSIGYAKRNGHSGWAIVNCYPMRATDPKDIGEYDPELSWENCETVAAFIRRAGITEVLIATGDITSAVLKQGFADMMAMFEREGVRPFTYAGLQRTDKEDKLPYAPHPLNRRKVLAWTGEKRYLRYENGRLTEV